MQYPRYYPIKVTSFSISFTRSSFEATCKVVPFPSSKCQKQHSILLHEASHVNVKTLKFKDLELTNPPPIKIG
jgi:hypothetical protein